MLDQGPGPRIVTGNVGQSRAWVRAENPNSIADCMTYTLQVRTASRSLPFMRVSSSVSNFSLKFMNWGCEQAGRYLGV